MKQAQKTGLDSYNRLWSFLFLPLRIYLLWRIIIGKEEAVRRDERYGRGWTEARPTGPLIWLHAVSVGETVAAVNLAESLLERRDDIHMLITTNTRSAARRIKAHSSSRILHAYQPFDHWLWVDRFLDYWRPDYAVMIESDFWPNLITRTAARNIPVSFASSQLSDKAFARWQRWPLLAATVFGRARHIFAVDNHQKERFSAIISPSSLAAAPQITALGSLKIPPNQLAADPNLTAMLIKAAGGRAIIIAASTHKGEDQIIISASQRAAQAHLAHFLVLAPRHPLSYKNIPGLAPDAARRSLGQIPKVGDGIFICDTLGEMGSLLTCGDLVILGGTFVPVGGHNPLEIALFGKPVIAGPSRFKNEDEFKTLTELGLIKNADDGEALYLGLAEALIAIAAKQPIIDRIQKQKIDNYVSKACARAANIADYLLIDIPAPSKKSAQLKTSTPSKTIAQLKKSTQLKKQV